MVIDAESLRCQCSEFEDPSVSSVVADLLYSHHFQVFKRVVRLVEVRGQWFVQLPHCYVGVVAIHPDVKRVFCFSNILHVALASANHVHHVLCLACEILGTEVF